MRPAYFAFIKREMLHNHGQEQEPDTTHPETVMSNCVRHYGSIWLQCWDTERTCTVYVEKQVVVAALTESRDCGCNVFEKLFTSTTPDDLIKLILLLLVAICSALLLTLAVLVCKCRKTKTPNPTDNGSYMSFGSPPTPPTPRPSSPLPPLPTSSPPTPTALETMRSECAALLNGNREQQATPDEIIYDIPNTAVRQSSDFIFNQVRAQVIANLGLGAGRNGSGKPPLQLPTIHEHNYRNVY